MIDDITLAGWEQPHPSLSLTQERLREAIREIRRLRECRTCGGFPHPSGKVCICGGTNFVEEELRQIRLALFAAEQDLAAHQAVVRELAEALEQALKEVHFHFGCDPLCEKERHMVLASPVVVTARTEGRG